MWVARSIALVLLVASCGQPTAPAGNSTPAAATCRLPVWWGEPESISPQFIHAAFIEVPGGKVTDVGRLPAPPVTFLDPMNDSSQLNSAAYFNATRTWLRLNRTELSPDGRQLAYWTYAQPNPKVYELHVATLATADDRVVYRSNTDVYIPMAFETGAVYLGHYALNPTPNDWVVDRLYRLKLAGGSLELVPGSERHLLPGWQLVADGAAWGVEWHQDLHRWSVMRLDLASHVISDWFDSPRDASDVVAQGVDAQHRLYVAYPDHLVRVESPGHATEFATDRPPLFAGSPGLPPVFASDTRGVWLAGFGGVRFYPPSGGKSTQYLAGQSDGPVYPAGPCA